MNRKIIFDAVRRLFGRGFTPRGVAALDATIDAALAPGAPVALNAAGRPLICKREGCARGDFAAAATVFGKWAMPLGGCCPGW